MEHVVEVNEAKFELMTEELSKDLKELKNKFPNIVELKSLSVFQVIKRYPSIKALINLLVNEIVEHGSFPIKKERWELGYNYLFIFETDH